MGEQVVDARTPARVSVDGVPTFVLDMPGPLRAMLIFRVGVVDETLPIHGITHLVEHLAMFPLMQGGVTDRFNGAVEPFRTRFMCTGTPSEVVQFMGSLTHSLQNLPVDRLENEKRVLRTEAANSNIGTPKGVWGWRYGPARLGLIDWEEFGLRWVGAEAVQHWAATRFTRENAVLWLSGPVPADLKVDLPHGERRPLPAVSPLDYKTPAEYQQGDRWAVLNMLGPRSTDFFIAGSVMEIRLRERLRNQASLAYQVSVTYQRLDPDAAELTAFADSLTPNARQAADTMAAELNALAQNGPTQAELDAVKGEARRARDHPDAGFGMLERDALDELEGLGMKTSMQLAAEIEATTPQSVAEAIRSAMGSAFIAVPTGVPMTTPGFTPIPAGSGRRQQGVRIVPMPGSGHSDEIDFNADGVSLTMPNLTVIGMRWRDIAVALWWSDGRRNLISSDGSGIRIVPDRWREVGPLLETIRQNVPAERWVPMDEPDAVPQQQGPACSVCQAQPAIEVTLQDPRSLFALYRRRVHGVMCRDCGIAKFREVQRRVLAAGWWSLPGLIYTPIALIANISVWSRFRKLPVPIRYSGVNPLPKGRSVWLHPSMLVPLLGLAVLILILHPWG